MLALGAFDFHCTLQSHRQPCNYDLVSLVTHSPSLLASLRPGENPYKVDVEQITQRAKLLQRYLSDEKKELQALYALQALMVHMEQPASEYSTAVSLTSVL